MTWINEEFRFRTKWFARGKVWRQATSSSAELPPLYVSLTPYSGELGVVGRVH